MPDIRSPTGITPYGQGLFFNFEVEGEMQAKVYLVGLADRMRDMQPAWRRIKTILTQHTEQRFRDEGGADSWWPPLAPTTILEKQLLGFGDKGILERTGRLRYSFQGGRDHIYQVDRQSFVWGSRVPYGIYHQSHLPRRKLPRRAMIYIDKNVLSKIIQVIRRWIEYGVIQ
jgi:hypothetical protein